MKPAVQIAFRTRRSAPPMWLPLDGGKSANGLAWDARDLLVAAVKKYGDPTDPRLCPGGPSWHVVTTRGLGVSYSGGDSYTVSGADTGDGVFSELLAAARLARTEPALWAAAARRSGELRDALELCAELRHAWAAGAEQCVVTTRGRNGLEAVTYPDHTEAIAALSEQYGVPARMVGSHVYAGSDPIGRVRKSGD